MENYSIDEEHAVRRHTGDELFSEESVYDFMKSRAKRMEEGQEEEEISSENKMQDYDNEVENYDDYLKLQRRLKTERSQRISQRSLHDGDDDDDESNIRNESSFRRTSSIRQEASKKPQSTKALRAISVVGRRQALVSDSAVWQAFLSKAELTDHGEEGADSDDENESHHYSLTIPFYAHPLQRQKWSDDQVLPHINWSDLFFDLFYVAAAYNLGSMLISAMNADEWSRGVVYFIGIFGPLYTMWENDLVYAARYTVVDYAHRLFEVVRYFFVSMAVLHVKSIDLLSDPKSIETFGLTSAILLESVMQLVLNFELVWYAEGDRTAIINHTKRKIIHQQIPATLVYLAATLISGILHFRTPQDDDTYSTRLLAAADDEKDKYASSSSGTNWSLSDLPLALCFLAYILNICSTMIRKLIFSNKRKEDIRDHFVPSNIDYMIHRYGEWIMLMIGESVLSLLINETVESGEYYIVFSLGVLTVIVLQALKFESEPSHADGHALWRNMHGGMVYSVLIQVLSMGLIAFGVSYKVMLTATVNAATEDGYRMLAAVPTVTDYATATLFSGSLTVVLLSLEIMLSSHRGVQKNYALLFKSIGEHRWNFNWPLVFIALAKLGLILFTATLSQWTTDYTLLTIAGFVVVTALSISRIVGFAIVYKGKELRELKHKIKSASKNVQRGLKKKVSLLADAASKARSGKSATSSVEATSTEFEFDKAIWDTSFDAIIVTDKRGVIKHINSTALAEFGYSVPSELIGRNISVLVGGGEAASHDKYLENFNKAHKTSSTIGKQRVLHSRRKDGSEFPCVIGIKEVPGSEYLVGYVRNMSDVAHQADKLLSPTKSFVDDTSFDAVVVTDYKGIIQQVNRTTLSEFGYEEEELIGNNISTLVGGNEAASHDKYLENFSKAHKTSSTIGKQRVLQSRRKDGTEFPCIIGIKKIPETELLIGYIRNMTGISAQQKALEVDELEQSSRGSSTVGREDFMDESFDAIIVINDHGTIKKVNQTAVDIFRYKNKEELTGKNISLLVGGGEADKHDKYLKRFKKAGKSDSTIGKQRVLYSRRKDGTEFPCIVGIKKSSKSDLLVGYIRDMSEISQQRHSVEITNINQLSAEG